MSVEFNPQEYRLGIHAHDLSVTTSSGERLLDGISLNIDQGDFLAIHGPSGAGKSLFATALCGIRFQEQRGLGFVHGGFFGKKLSRSKNGIRYGGNVIYRMTHQTTNEKTDLDNSHNILRRHIGYVPQEPILDGKMTARANILAPAALKQIPVDEEMFHDVSFNLGIDEIMHKKAGDLSGGQKQRVSIARALVGAPNAIILDEPTANLNPALKDETNLMLQRINRRFGMTIIAVTHEDTLATRRIEMVKGQIVSDGIISE